MINNNYGSYIHLLTYIFSALQIKYIIIIIIIIIT